MALCKRVVRFGANTLAQVMPLSALGGANSGGYLATKFCKLNSFSSLPPNIYFNHNKARVIDTLDLVKALEAEGVPSTQAKRVVAKAVNDSLEKNVANSPASKAEMQMEHHFSMLQHEIEKLRTDIEKMRSELRYEIDKVTTGQRLDLNLERGRIRDELANQNAETTNLTNKLDRDIGFKNFQSDMKKSSSELRDSKDKHSRSITPKFDAAADAAVKDFRKLWIGFVGSLFAITTGSAIFEK